MTATQSSRASPTTARAAPAPVLEVFASIQGEGRFVGEPQVFVRLFGCPLRCRWCDTPGSWELPAEPRARIATTSGVRRARGWATPAEVAGWIAEAEGGPARTISVTGGEPLLWPEFLRELRGHAGARRVHLETGGAHPVALERVLDAVDHVSLDLKLPADMDAPHPIRAPLAADPARERGAHELVPPGPVPRDEREWARTRARVLELVRGRDACAKVIVAGGRAAAEFVPLLDDVAALAPDLSLYLQPVTPMNGVPAPRAELLLALSELALERQLCVRVVPQVHRVLAIP